MNFVKLSLGNPVAVIVGIIMALMFGAISLSRLPIQLTPEIQEPKITIQTSWRAAAPNEIEAEIIEPQEDVLRGLPGMTEIEATAYEGYAEVSLTFAVDMELNRALIEVLNRLNQVPSYPEDADEPVLATVGGDASAVTWMNVFTLPGNDNPIAGYKDFVEDTVQTRFEQVPGVAESEVYGGRNREVRITFDPYKVASLDIQLPVVSRLSGSGDDVSGGSTDVGKRKYSVRFVGKYNGQELGGLIIDWRDGRPVYLRDVATVEEKLVDVDEFVLTNHGPSMAVNAKREVGVNVLKVMQGIDAAVEELNEGVLGRAGLTISKEFDETVYIEQSINMLRNNLGMGIFLAIVVLWFFLRKVRATLTVAIAIPICLLTSFLLMYMASRTLNIISMAGLAFAVGMVLDASIVVLENIVRLREKGESPEDASEKGAMQVLGALIASTATTVAIFLPIVYLEGEAGQMFGDLALTITAAICLSFIVATTVIPSFAKEHLGKISFDDGHQHWWDGGTALIMKLTSTGKKRLFWILVLTIPPILIALKLLPQADYLPEGNRDLAFAILLTPPGANIGHIREELGYQVQERIKPHVEEEKEPFIRRYFFVGYFGGVFMGIIAKEQGEMDKVLVTLQEIVSGFPDTLGFAQRASLFEGFGGGKNIDIDIQGRDLPALMQAALKGMMTTQEAIPGAQVRPIPGLELAQPELRLVPNERRITEAGWDRGIMAGVTQALGDGLYVGDYFNGDKTLDIIVRAEAWDTPEELINIPVATPNAGVLPLGELVELQRTAGPEQIRRINRRRTVTLRVTPPPGISLEQTLRVLQEKVEPVIREALPIEGDISYGGSADKLETALADMQNSFLLAIAILYLLMSALFRSFRDSLLVILALPLATVGGVVALYVINTVPALLGSPLFQPMDLITMIGFIILLGLVVNNAILLVHQARTAEREGMNRTDAVQQAVRQRLRPIVMSTMTSLFGMLPLLLVPGPGSELYRGMAGVIVGGMSVSTVFTLILLPSLLRLREHKHGSNVAVSMGASQPGQKPV